MVWILCVELRQPTEKITQMCSVVNSSFFFFQFYRYTAIMPDKNIVTNSVIQKSKISKGLLKSFFSAKHDIIDITILTNVCKYVNMKLIHKIQKRLPNRSIWMLWVHFDFPQTL